MPILARCRRYHEGNSHYGRRGVPENRRRKRKLTVTELLIYNYLVENGYNPSTTYRNFLAIRVPADIKEALIKGEIHLLGKEDQELFLRLFGEGQKIIINSKVGTNQNI